MPIYEYRCEPCDHAFETLIRSQSDAAKCPRCGSIEVAKQFSVPAAAQSQGQGQGGSLPMAAGPGGCGAPACGSGCQFG